MKVLILCGGYGSRLGNLGVELPKPMVPIDGKPILWHIMKGFSHWGLREFVLCLGYRSDLIKQYFLSLPLMVGDVTLDLSAGCAPVAHGCADEVDWRITLAETGLDSLTGHRVKRAAAYVPPEDDCFALTYGDGVCDVDFRKVVEFHRAHGKLATVTAVHPPGRFGELAIENGGPIGGAVREFNEKPQASAGWISGGFFVFQRTFLDRLSDDPRLVLEEEPLRELARAGELVAYRHEGFWFAMDTPRDYRQLADLAAAGQPPWAVWERGRA
jgi:glucose-1-phosphate cytidylyltransferase